VLGHPDLLAAAAHRRTVKLRDGRHAQMIYAPLPPDRRRTAPHHEAAKAVVIVGGRRERVDPVDIVGLVAPYETQCQGKRAYSKPDAKRASARAQAKGGQMRVYRCPHCDWYHVGHSNTPRPEARPA
jgi:hypothetical protein